jgi:cytochrome c553
MKSRLSAVVLSLIIAGSLLAAHDAGARPPIRKAFFSLYPVAVGTQLDNLPSNTGHCGVCHFDFNGGGPRNPYGLGIQVGISNGLSNTDAILAIQNDESDGDGYINLTEITDIADWSNTPTFPGLTSSNVGSVINIPISEVEPYLTPMGGTDTIPPIVTVLTPNGGESIDAETHYAITYSASDAGGISHLNIFLSDDGGVTYEPVALNVTTGTGYSWFVPNLPGTASRIAVEAVDNSGNSTTDVSDADFTINEVTGGTAPTTLRDMHMSGTQPFGGAILDDPDLTCATCHGNYDSANEPWYNWRGSMMAQAARDPFFYACLAVAEQDAPSVGDICIRCHSPGGWEEGRSVDTSGGLLTVKDRNSIQCDFCHRAVDFNYVEGVSPLQDVAVLANIVPIPLQYGNGQFINDPAPLKRGPYADAQASHEFVESPFHRSANICGTCHDVSSPVFDRTGPYDYTPNTFNLQHPDMDIRNMIPIERTFSEWSMSEYATTGVYAPQFAGNKPDGIVSKCEDCHMHDVNAKGCNVTGVSKRADLGLHDFTGGNTFVPEIVSTFYPDEVSTAQLQAAVARADTMLRKAATLDVTPEDFGVTVRVTNETGHKLPSGYPEGRRIWISVKAYDSTAALVYESAAYNFSTGDLTVDEDAKVYEIHPGLSPGLAAALGLTAGQTFHFVLNDTVYSDNRIPPRGVTNANFLAVQSPPVDHTYADGQYWDDTDYHLPSTAKNVDVTLYYQSTSKEYVEFLRDENHTNQAGQNLFDAWFDQGMSEPVAMAEASVQVDVTTGGVDGGRSLLAYSLSQNTPNPFVGATTIAYSLAGRQRVTISVYDIAGRQVVTLIDEIQEPNRYKAEWKGLNSKGESVPPGVYFIRYSAGGHVFSKKAILLK